MRDAERWPLLDAAFDHIAQDNALPLRADWRAPVRWRGAFAAAEEELRTLTPAEIELLAVGEFEEGRVPREHAPLANAILNIVFDGELHDAIYAPGLAYPRPPAGYVLSDAAKACGRPGGTFWRRVIARLGLRGAA